MNWPTPQEYNEAIQIPASAFVDEDLKSATPLLNALGLPRPVTGAFASVYKMSKGESSWAVRCFLNHREEQKERYEKTAEFVLFDDLDCTVPFYYIEQGIRVKGRWYPILKMEWIDGVTLEKYLQDNYSDSNKMTLLRESFREMCLDLDRAGIAHGDLQHGNILVAEDGLRLVDYDALFVPSLKGKQSLELGHPNYQHPLRRPTHYDTSVDNFSMWLIDLSLLTVSLDQKLYEKFLGGDDCILFRRTDLRYPENSELFKDLLSHKNSDIKSGAELLLRMLWSIPESVPPISASAAEIDVLPGVGSSELIHGADGAGLPFGSLASRGEYGAHNYDSSRSEIVEVPRLEPSGPAPFKLDVYRDVIQKVRGTRGLGRSAVGRTWHHVTSFVARGADSFLRKLDLDIWIRRHKARALICVDVGRYETAARHYNVVLDEIERFSNYSREVCEVRILLSSALVKQGNLNLANNLLRLASQSAEDELVHITHLLLTLNCIDKGDTEGALKLIAGKTDFLKNVGSALESPLVRQYGSNTSIFQLLSIWRSQIRLKAELDTLKQVVELQGSCYMEIAASSSLKIDKLAAESFLSSLVTFFEEENYKWCLIAFDYLVESLLQCRLKHGFSSSLDGDIFCEDGVTLESALKDLGISDQLLIRFQGTPMRFCLIYRFLKTASSSDSYMRALELIQSLPYSMQSECLSRTKILDNLRLVEILGQLMYSWYLNLESRPASLVKAISSQSFAAILGRTLIPSCAVAAYKDGRVGEVEELSTCIDRVQFPIKSKELVDKVADMNSAAAGCILAALLRSPESQFFKELGEPVLSRKKRVFYLVDKYLFSPRLEVIAWTLYSCRIAEDFESLDHFKTRFETLKLHHEVVKSQPHILLSEWVECLQGILPTLRDKGDFTPENWWRYFMIELELKTGRRVRN